MRERERERRLDIRMQCGLDRHRLHLPDLAVLVAMQEDGDVDAEEAVLRLALHLVLQVHVADGGGHAGMQLRVRRVTFHPSLRAHPMISEEHM